MLCMKKLEIIVTSCRRCGLGIRCESNPTCGKGNSFESTKVNPTNSAPDIYEELQQRTPADRTMTSIVGNHECAVGKDRDCDDQVVSVIPFLNSSSSENHLTRGYCRNLICPVSIHGLGG